MLSKKKTSVVKGLAKIYGHLLWMNSIFSQNSGFTCLHTGINKYTVSHEIKQLSMILLDFKPCKNKGVIGNDILVQAREFIKQKRCISLGRGYNYKLG